MFKTDSFVRSDLAPTGITFCALEILPLFSDNFDFLDLDDVIRDILINEEVHCRNIYIDVLPEKEVAIVAQYDFLLNFELRNRFYTKFLAQKSILNSFLA